MVLPYSLLGIGFCLFVVVYVHCKAFLWSKMIGQKHIDPCEKLIDLNKDDVQWRVFE